MKLQKKLHYYYNSIWVSYVLLVNREIYYQFCPSRASAQDPVQVPSIPIAPTPYNQNRYQKKKRIPLLVSGILLSSSRIYNLSRRKVIIAGRQLHSCRLQHTPPDQLLARNLQYSRSEILLCFLLCQLDSRLFSCQGSSAPIVSISCDLYRDV